MAAKTKEKINTMRYELHAIADSNCTSWYDEILGEDADARAAKDKAHEIASGEYWGVVIVDNLDKIADFGSDEHGKPIVREVRD